MKPQHHDQQQAAHEADKGKYSGQPKSSVLGGAQLTVGKSSYSSPNRDPRGGEEPHGGSAEGAPAGHAPAKGSSKNQNHKSLQIATTHMAKNDPSTGNAGLASLASPGGDGSSAYVSRERASGSHPFGHAGAKGHNNPVQMADLTSPRNAIGGVSGIVTNQQSQYSNIMNRRKSNTMSNPHGPVDITAIMRATRGGMNNSNDPQAPGQGQDAALGSGIHQASNSKNQKNLSSRGGRNHSNTQGGTQSSKQGSVQMAGSKDHGVHLPPMPLTPTEQNRQRERESNNSTAQNGAGPSASRGTKKGQGASEPRQGSSGAGARGAGDSQAPTGSTNANGQFYQQSKRSGARDHSLNNQDTSAQPYNTNRVFQNQTQSTNLSNEFRNPQKMKMLYKKSINSHRATSQATGLGGAAHREGQGLQSHRNNHQGGHFSPPRQLPGQKAASGAAGTAAYYQSQRDHSNGPNPGGYPDMYQSPSSQVVQNHSYQANQQNPTPAANEPLDIERLLLGTGPPPDPATLNLPCWEPTKCSVRENGIIMGYAANTNQGIIRDYNEDRVSIVLNIMQPPTKKDVENWPKCSFFGVFDGHGGNTCADFLRDNLHQFIIKDQMFPQNPRQAIVNGYKKAEAYFLDTVEAFAQGRQHMLDKSGSCAIVALLVEKKVYVINVGDSRAVMSADGGNYCMNLSIDHKPNDENEQKRILQNGGRVYQTQTIARGDTYKQVQTITYQPGQDNSAVLQQADQTQREENPNIIYGPFRVFPGRLSVSRTFGDIEAKREKFGGNPNVVIAVPEIKEFSIDDKMDFLLLGCDGIFDKISNAEVIKQSWIAAKKNFHAKEQPIHQICGYVVEQVMKASVAYKTLDNITVVMLAFKNFKHALSEEFQNINNPNAGNSESHQDLQSKESGQVGSVHVGPEEQSQQRASQPSSLLPNSGQNAPLENLDSSNGGLVFHENSDTINLSKDEVNRGLNLPNCDLVVGDAEVMRHKPRMPAQKKQKISRHSQASGSKGLQGSAAFTSPDQSSSEIQKPLSPVIRRSAINNLVGNSSQGSSADHSQQSNFGTQKLALNGQLIEGGSTNQKHSSTLRNQIYGQSLPGVAGQAQTTKNSQNKRFNMRVGSLGSAVNNSLVGSFGNSAGSATESTLAGGPGGGIMGSSVGKHGNPLSQREKQSALKEPVMSKYQRGNQAHDGNNLNSLNVNDLSLPYPGPPGGGSSTAGSAGHHGQPLPKSSGFKTNRNSQYDNRIFNAQQQRPTIADIKAIPPAEQSYKNQNWPSSPSSNIQTQRNGQVGGNLSRGKQFIGSSSGLAPSSPLDEGAGPSTHYDSQPTKFKQQKQNNSMLQNAQGATAGGKSNMRHFNQDRVSARAQMSGSGGLSSLIPSGGSGGANPLSAGPAQGATMTFGEIQKQSDRNHQSQQEGALTQKMTNPATGGPSSNILINKRNSRASKSRGNSNQTPNVQHLSIIAKTGSQPKQDEQDTGR